ncbi:hypothetical protein J7I94_28800 [Streptomyces sp. ISL-12]|uniref:hypothetical protein n=1 Tax=Streptomyces sp. ISL-12 TaxID=2819177 RepID=UPI001BE5438E|nr:hypothetical protein [Streptomyces sp. ISL-12]MBT2414498.1 hypothetical protein [Streptomyces sp. ISL-12]
MKKRSMLAIASLATGFVVAAVTPSHGVTDLPVDPHTATDALSHVDIGKDVLAPHEDTPKD